LENEEVKKGLSEKISPLSPLGQGGGEKPITEEVIVKASEEEVTGSEEDEESKEEYSDSALAPVDMPKESGSKQDEGRSPLAKEDMEAVVEWLAWYRSSPVKMEPSVLDSLVSELLPKDLMVSDPAFSLTSEGFPEFREKEEGSAKVGDGSKRYSPLPRTGESAKSKGK
ncbi:hypothetical protein U1Q18_042593, partial [Sarracenia purpurea var. burkii]